VNEGEAENYYGHPKEDEKQQRQGTEDAENRIERPSGKAAMG